MSDIERIPPEEAIEKVAQGEALLVCAYEDEEKCRALGIEESLTLEDLERMLPSLSRDRVLVFYCA